MKKVIYCLLGILMILILAGCPGGDLPTPVKVDVPSAVKEIEAKFSCKVGLQKQVYVHGNLDALASPTDIANQSASVDTWFAASGYGGSSILADYDGTKVNQYFADTFTGLPSGIVEAYFITGFKGIATLVNNDGLGLGDVSAPLITGAALSTLASNGWTVNMLGNNEKIAARYLSGMGSVLAAMNASNELDYYVQDDTAVDFAKLVVCYQEKDPRFDLEIKKTLKGDVLVIGGSNLYNIEITNNGPDAAPGPITVVDTLPTGVVWDGNSPTDWSCSLTSTSPDVVSCAFTGTLPLAAGASINLPLTVTVNKEANKEVRNCAKLDVKGDANPENDESCVTSPVRPPQGDGFDLETKKTLKGDVLVIDGTGHYNIEITNNGPDAAPGPITVVDSLPTGVVWDGNSPTNWTCSLTSTSPDVVTCTYTGSLPLASGASINLPLTVTVNKEANKEVRNCAKVIAKGDTNSENDESCVTNPVRPPEGHGFDLETSKTLKGDVLNIGHPNYYIIQVSNNGPDAAPGPITVKDVLPAGVVWNGVSPVDWSCSQISVNLDVVECEYNGSLPLASGDSINLNLTVNVNEKVGDRATNCATVYAEGDSNNENDTGCVTNKSNR